MDIAIIGILFACIGSFLNVVIYRLPRNESLIFPRSHCPQCEEIIPIWHNIPIISYILMRGKCRECGVPIAFRYVLVEAITPLLAIGLYLIYGPTWEMLKFTTLILLLIPAAFIDLDHKLLLNKITIPGIVIGLIFSISLEPTKFYQPLLGMIAGGGLLAAVALLGQLIYKQESMGGGDIKFGAMIGAFMTADAVLISLLLSFFIASLFAVIGILIGKFKRRSAIPFGPFIALGTLVSIGFKNQLFAFYLKWIGVN